MPRLKQSAWTEAVSSNPTDEALDGKWLKITAGNKQKLVQDPSCVQSITVPYIHTSTINAF
jgi:hypothetical protein